MFEIQGWRPRICQNFEITRTIHSNNERLEAYTGKVRKIPFIFDIDLGVKRIFGFIERHVTKKSTQ